MTLYAKAGERVTCENGHTICLVGRDLQWGGYYQEGDFIDWLQPEPAVGTMPEPCKRCGAAWWRGQCYHFADGWRR